MWNMKQINILHLTVFGPALRYLENLKKKIYTAWK